MIPKSYKEVLKKVIEENNLDKSFTEDAVSFFWSEVRKNLAEMSTSHLTIGKLGTFMVKPWKVDELLGISERFLEKASQERMLSFKDYGYVKAIERRKTLLLKMKAEFEKENLRKQEAKKRREEYEISKNLDKQETDPGGSD